MIDFTYGGRDPTLTDVADKPPKRTAALDIAFDGYGFPMCEWIHRREARHPVAKVNAVFVSVPPLRVFGNILLV